MTHYDSAMKRHSARTLLLAPVLLANAALAQQAPTAPTPPTPPIDPGTYVPEAPPPPAITLTATPPGMPTNRTPSVIDLLRREGSRAVRHVTCPDAQRFIFALNWLPADDPRTLYRRKDPREWISQQQFDMLADADKEHYERATADAYYFYYTRYGSPVAYCRPLDILCNAAGGGDALRGKKFLDFGFGGIGQLRLLASIGCNVTGVEVDPLLQALYSKPEDVGLIEGTGTGVKTPDGVLRLLYGRWPADATTVTDVGDGYDVFLSKNTLKRGYVHPEPPEGETVDPRRLFNLGVDDETFVSEVARILRPGGHWMVYNICPAPAKEGQPYIPWADGRFPFDRALVEKHGFEVIAWDQDDTPTMRDIAKALFWDKGDAKGEGAMDLENDLAVTYTLLRKRSEEAESK
jgi:SAM-dependent methyltransferase